ncbi:hypothetical protein FRC08_011690 [Ceratobasidium sp. 394]|nr:hypothetical protein FRC08_011690 [Ceratobasidium sp. 394]
MITAPIIPLLLLPLQALAQSTDYGPQLTAAALEIAGAISAACNTTDPCETFVTSVIPRCQKLQGDPGCWCGNHDPLHFCAICMSNPTDNRTSPDQTAAAIEGHQRYHTVCNAWETALNASASAATASVTATATNGQSSATISAAPSSGSKTPIGAIVGGAVGGGVALIVGILGLLYWMKSRDANRTIRPSSVSLFSAPMSSNGQPYSGYSSPAPQMGYKAEYAPAMPYNGTGMHSPPPPTTIPSYSKYPEPMLPG